jgi:hypothetical protein
MTHNNLNGFSSSKSNNEIGCWDRGKKKKKKRLPKEDKMIIEETKSEFKRLYFGFIV